MRFYPRTALTRAQGNAEGDEEEHKTVASIKDLTRYGPVISSNEGLALLAIIERLQGAKP
jgi:hypothetical protein